MHSWSEEVILEFFEDQWFHFCRLDDDLYPLSESYYDQFCLIVRVAFRCGVINENGFDFWFDMARVVRDDQRQRQGLNRIWDEDELFQEAS